MRHPLISIIIPTYNKGPVLARTLQALQLQTVSCDHYEVLIIDDGSTDGTDIIVAGFSPPYAQRYVRQENLGAGWARNHGVELARGAILLFLDSDIVLYPDAVGAHLAAQHQFNRSLMVSRILPMDPNPNGLEDLFFQEALDFGPDGKLMTWNHAITRCLSMKKQHFLEIGGFDTRLRRCQDIDFGYRAEQLNFEIRYLSQARAWHNHSLSLEQRCLVERKNHRAFAALFQKHPHLSAQLPYLIDKSPVNWRVDPPALIAKKCARSALATKPARVAVRWIWKVLYRTAAPESLLRSVYWKMISSYQLLGYREGFQSLSNVRESQQG